MASESLLEQGVPLGQTIIPQANGIPPSEDEEKTRVVAWANKYRGATVADLDLAPALSTSPTTSLEEAMLSASSHDYSHLTVLSETTRSLLGYLPISRLKSLFETKQIQPSDPVSKAMVKFQRRGDKKYEVITMETELWELEGFFENIGSLATGTEQDFAVVTDGDANSYSELSPRVIFKSSLDGDPVWASLEGQRDRVRFIPISRQWVSIRDTDAGASALARYLWSCKTGHSTQRVLAALKHAMGLTGRTNCRTYPLRT